MDGDAAVRLEGGVQRDVVGEADQRLQRKPAEVDQREQTGSAGPSPGTDDGTIPGVGEGVDERGGTDVVGPGEIPAALVEARRGRKLVTLGQSGHAAVESFAIEWRGGGD